MNGMSSDSESELDIDLVEVPDVPLFDLVSQRLLLVSVPESEENPDEFMRNKAIKEFGVEPSSLHIVDIKGTYICFDGSKIADGLFTTHNNARRVRFINYNDVRQRLLVVGLRVRTKERTVKRGRRSQMR